ncbi:hypothetical protein NUBL2888_31110 [Klebsiella pneumoniae]|nr:hypothetical protein NUBL2888_31110 [Klebsiella pneumoniae]
MKCQLFATMSWPFLCQCWYQFKLTEQLQERQTTSYVKNVMTAFVEDAHPVHIVKVKPVAVGLVEIHYEP